MTSSLAGQGATAQLGVGATGADVTDWFRDQLLAALADPLRNLPKSFLTYMSDYVATSGFNIPFGQIVGALNFVPNQSTGTNAFSGTLGGSSNTSGSGPSVTGLAAGSYFILAGYTGLADSAVVTVQWDIKPAAVTLFSVSGSETASPGSSCAAFGFTTLADVADITSTYTVTNAAGTSRVWSIANMQIAAIKTANA